MIPTYLICFKIQYAYPPIKLLSYLSSGKFNLTIPFLWVFRFAKNSFYKLTENPERMAGSDLALHSHVPAWKKLGLKLKHVKDEETTDAIVQRTAATPKAAITTTRKSSLKRERDTSSHETFNGEPPLSSKKKRRLDGGIGNGLRAGGSRDGGESLKSNEKSVRFAPDKGNQSTTGAADGILETTVNAEREEQKKEKQKKSKEGHGKTKQCTTSTSPANASHSHETPILSYLTRYHEDRSAWKFRKNRETSLFKHMFSLERVPSRYNSALLAYLTGLKGEAARQRIRQAAEQAIKADNKAADDAVLMTSEQRAKYANAIKEFRSRLSQRKNEDLDVGIPVDDKDSKTQKMLEARRRGELILWVMNSRANSTMPLPGGVLRKASTQIKPTAPAKKKRKNRTAHVELSSSSSSSSSDDSDDSGTDSDDEEEDREDPDDPSSSSGSDSDSDPDSSLNSSDAKSSQASESSSSGSDSQTSSDSESSSSSSSLSSSSSDSSDSSSDSN